MCCSSRCDQFSPIAYTEEAREARLEGELVLSLVISKKGVPQNVRVVQSLGKGLDEQAVITTRQWRFKPGMYRNRAVAVSTTMRLWFSHCKAYGVSEVVPAPGTDYSVAESVKGFAHLTKILRTCGNNARMLQKKACAPVCIDRVLPKLPGDSQRPAAQGTVGLSLLIATDGTVSTVRVVQSVDKNLDEEAIAAARKWRFRPALYKFEPIPSRAAADVRFGVCAGPVVSALVSAPE